MVIICFENSIRGRGNCPTFPAAYSHDYINNAISSRPAIFMFYHLITTKGPVFYHLIITKGKVSTHCFCITFRNTSAHDNTKYTVTLVKYIWTWWIHFIICKILFPNIHSLICNFKILSLLMNSNLPRCGFNEFLTSFRLWIFNNPSKHSKGLFLLKYSAIKLWKLKSGSINRLLSLIVAEFHDRKRFFSPF